MGSKYKVEYWDARNCIYVTSGCFNSFRKAKRAAKNLCKSIFKVRKDWYCITIMVSEIKK